MLDIATAPENVEVESTINSEGDATRTTAPAPTPPSVIPPKIETLLKLLDDPIVIWALAPPLRFPAILIVFVPENDVSFPILSVKPEDCVFKILRVVAFALNSVAVVAVVVISPPFTAISSLKVAPEALIPFVKL